MHFSAFKVKWSFNCQTKDWFLYFYPKVYEWICIFTKCAVKFSITDVDLKDFGRSEDSEGAAWSVNHQKEGVTVSHTCVLPWRSALLTIEGIKLLFGFIRLCFSASAALDVSQHIGTEGVARRLCDATTQKKKKKIWHMHTSATNVPMCTLACFCPWVSLVKPEEQ